MWINLTDLDGNTFSVNMDLIVAVRENGTPPNRTTTLWAKDALTFTALESRMEIMSMVLTFDG